MGHLPDAQARDMGTHDLDAVRDYLNESLFAFCYHIMGYRDIIPSLHGEVCAFVERWGVGEDLNRRLMIQIPRDFFKTSVCTRANALWQIARSDGALTVAIFNERELNSKRWLGSIRGIVEGSPLFKEVYRHVLPPRLYEEGSPRRGWKWSDDAMNFNGRQVGEPEFSLSAHGVGGATTGSHWHRVIKDDVLSFEASRSEVTMQMVSEWLEASRELERPATEGCDLIVCTPWSYRDSYKHVLEVYGDEYLFYRRSALEIDDSGEEASIFPQKLSTETLQRERERNEFKFASQKMCRPRAGKETSFTSEDVSFGTLQGDAFLIEIPYYRPDAFDLGGSPLADLDEIQVPRRVPLDWMDKMVFLDPAPSEPTDQRREGPAARNALICVGEDPWGRLYLLDVEAIREDPLDVLRRGFHMMIRNGTNRFGCEHVNFSKLYQPIMRYVRDHEFKGFHVRYTPLEPGRTDKNTRITAMIPDFRAHLWYWNRPVAEKPYRELVDFPYGETKDIIDVMSYAKGHLRRPESPEEFEFRREEAHRMGYVESRDEVTGY